MGKHGFDFVWHPDEEGIRQSRLYGFMESCGIASYDALYRRSIEDVEWFTENLLEFLQVEFDTPYRKILDLSRGGPWARWCVGGELNISRSCLDRHIDNRREDAPAVIWEGEEGCSRILSYGDLFESVKRCASGLRALGLRRGDGIGVFLPMMPETVVALLAIARIGAVAAPLFSGFGPAAVEARLRDIRARALITCDAFPRRGLAVPIYKIASEAVRRIGGGTRMIVVPRLGSGIPSGSENHIRWDDLLNSSDAAEYPERTGAEDPLIVLYSSGTTGQPKGILHSHCGFPIKAAQDMAFGTDVGPEDRISWVTDIGWMMGPWLIYGATLLGAAMVLYDGAPDYPHHDRLWEFSARNAVSVLGLSPTLVRSTSAHKGEPRSEYDLSRLRVFASTGEPWNPDPWWWLFEKVGGRKVPIINYSGGTEISGGILMGNPLTPIKPCAFAGPCPGIDADIVDENGNSLETGVGELVIRKPWIGMARGFWNDPERYLNTYWSYWPGVWRHGDWAERDREGNWYILGRSDDTLKIAGKRVGPAEIESVLVSHPDVVEAAVIGIPDQLKGNVAIAFCVPSPGFEKNPGLCEALQQLIATELGKSLCPARIFLVSALPRTRNSKVMRRVIRNAYLHEDLGNTAALENPDVIEEIQLLS